MDRRWIGRLISTLHELLPGPALLWRRGDIGIKEKKKMKSLFVGNMNFRTTESELRALFEPYGEITRLQVMTDRETGRSRGFAFVELAREEDAAKAIAELNGTEFAGRALNVSEARPKPERNGFRNRAYEGREEYAGGDYGRQRRARW